MMGTHQPQKELFSYRVDLDRRIRADHPLRRIRAVLDLSFVRPIVQPFYGSNGHVGTDPVILMKMLLLLFLDDIPSERELMGIIAERLDYLWFLGYGLDDVIPHHSVLSKARARWGGEVFRDLFVRTVQQCVEAGLVDGQKLHLDSSLIKANAAKDSIISSAPEVIAALRAAYAVQEQKFEERGDSPVNATRLSTTDPEATLARSNATSTSQLSYKHHRAIDDAHGVITAVETTTGCKGDAAQLPVLVGEHASHTGCAATTVIGDKHYGSAENYRYCQSRNITTHLGRAPAATKNIFPASRFIYEAAQDRYRCPAGHYLYYHNFKKDDQLIEYQISDAALCAQCPMRSQCTRSVGGRTLTRPAFTELVQEGRAQAGSQAARRDLSRRQYLMEGSFADASNNHGFKRARWRGLWRQQIQDWLIAAVQNLRILLRAGRRPSAAVFTTLRSAIHLIFLFRAVLLSKEFLFLFTLKPSHPKPIPFPGFHS